MAAGEEEDEEASLLAAIPATLEPYMSAAAQLAAEWYRGLAREQPRSLSRPDAKVPPIIGPTGRAALLDAQDFDPRPAELPPREQIEATVRWAMHQPPPVEPARETADLDPEDMSEDELRQEVERLRLEPVVDAPQQELQPAATPRQARVSARVSVTGSTASLLPSSTPAERPAEPERLPR